MEKVILKNVVKKETAKGVFFTIELSDGRKGISSTDLTDKMGSEVELEIKESKEYEGKMQYYFNFPKPAGQQSGKFPAKDWTFEKKRAALECAVEFGKGKDVKSFDILEVANKFFNDFLNLK